MKRKLISLTLALVLCVCLVACGDTDNKIDKLPNLEILYEKDASLQNDYSMIAVNPEAPFVSSTDETPLAAGTVKINTVGAGAFIDWICLKSTLDLIKGYGEKDYGETLFFVFDDVYSAAKTSANIPKATAENKNVRISTTTSVNDSGLLGYLEPIFEAEYGYDIQIASAGTGAAIKAAKYGNADLILVHSKSQETAFVDAGFAMTREGYASERITFMYNFFVLVGPTADPAGVKNAADAKAAFAAIATAKSKFVSRGDASGTHTKEVSLWDKAVGITADVEALPAGIADWYISAGAGMGACLTMANEYSAYCLTDKATFLTYKNFVETDA